MDVIVEPTSLFDQSLGDVGNQRPDIHIRNPRNSRDQVIIDVALTGVDGQSRTSDEAVERPLQVRYADLYAANQGSTELINEMYTEEVPLCFMGQDVLYHQPLSLD